MNTLSDWKKKIIQEGCCDFAIITTNGKIEFCKTLTEIKKELQKYKSYDHPKVFTLLHKRYECTEDSILVNMKDNSVVARFTDSKTIEFLLNKPNQFIYKLIKDI